MGQRYRNSETGELVELVGTMQVEASFLGSSENPAHVVEEWGIFRRLPPGSGCMATTKRTYDRGERLLPARVRPERMATAGGRSQAQ